MHETSKSKLHLPLRLLAEPLLLDAALPLREREARLPLRDRLGDREPAKRIPMLGTKAILNLIPLKLGLRSTALLSLNEWLTRCTAAS